MGINPNDKQKASPATASQPETAPGSAAKAAASRANGQQSKGPKTARGKSISRWNALKHGGAVKELFILKGEQLTEYPIFKKMSDELQEELEGTAYLEERIYANRLVSDAWRLHRLCKVEFDFADTPAIAQAVPTLMRYIAHAEHSFDRSYEQVRKLRQRVEETEAAEAEEAEAEAEEPGLEPEGAEIAAEGKGGLRPAHAIVLRRAARRAAGRANLQSRMPHTTSVKRTKLAS